VRDRRVLAQHGDDAGARRGLRLHRQERNAAQLRDRSRARVLRRLVRADPRRRVRDLGGAGPPDDRGADQPGDPGDPGPGLAGARRVGAGLRLGCLRDLRQAAPRLHLHRRRIALHLGLRRSRRPRHRRQRRAVGHGPPLRQLRRLRRAPVHLAAVLSPPARGRAPGLGRPRRGRVHARGDDLPHRAARLGHRVPRPVRGRSSLPRVHVLSERRLLRSAGRRRRGRAVTVGHHGGRTAGPLRARRRSLWRRSREPDPAPRRRLRRRLRPPRRMSNLDLEQRDQAVLAQGRHPGGADGLRDLHLGRDQPAVGEHGRSPGARLPDPDRQRRRGVQRSVSARRALPGLHLGGVHQALLAQGRGRDAAADHDRDDLRRSPWPRGRHQSQRLGLPLVRQLRPRPQRLPGGLRGRAELQRLDLRRSQRSQQALPSEERRAGAERDAGRGVRREGFLEFL
jgi:hypothetical protein